MGHGTSDAVMEFLSVSDQVITYRLGLEFRRPTEVLPLDSLLPARYLRIQVASPPPKRVDDSPWFSGLRVRGGEDGERDFKPDDLTWQDTDGVFPLMGTSPLAQPSPKTLICDQWVAATAVPPVDALARCFRLIPAEGPDTRPLNHFLSAYYPTPLIDGEQLQLVGVKYYCEGELPLERPIDEYCTVCLGTNFYPIGRDSVEYIVSARQTVRKSNGAPDRPQFAGPPVW